MAVFKALWVTEAPHGVYETQVVERDTGDLPAGDVLIRVQYSSLNYKDALSASGNRGVTRKYPHTPGIDAAGVVAESSVAEFAAGDEVIVTGYDLGMNTAGGFGQYIRVPAAWVIKRPQGLSLREAMILGTAGLTAALCVEKLERSGLRPDHGSVLVTGASGGVGSIAVELLAKLGYTVAAATGKPSWGRLVGWGLFLAILAWSWKGAEMNPAVLFRDAGNMATFAADFFPPDFGNWKLYLSEMLVTVQIALWGTVLAIVCAIPLSILASENIVPWWVYQPVRRVMDACRSINEMVFAMLFVVAVGLGPFAGVLALFISTTGVLAKLFAEAVEAIDPGPVEGVRATGASALQEVIFGVIPQVLPLWISYSLYRFESNVRSATVVGMVGAGGIGVILWEAIRGFQFGQTCAVLIVIIVVVSLIDVLSQRLRKLFI